MSEIVPTVLKSSLWLPCNIHDVSFSLVERYMNHPPAHLPENVSERLE